MTIEQAPRRTLGRFGAPLLLLAAMWAVHIADAILPGSFLGVGIRSWDPSGLPGILISPFLHANWPHLIANSLPLLVLGTLVAAEGARRFWTVTAVVTLVSGFGTWLVNAPGTITVGASGLVFGYFGYIVMRVFRPGPVSHRFGYAIVAIVIVLAYGGSMLAGVIGVREGVSWQAHLFGAIGGAVAALGSRPRAASRR